MKNENNMQEFLMSFYHILTVV